MNKPELSRPSAASSTDLSRMDASEKMLGREVHEVTIRMLPVQLDNELMLANFADHLGSNWLDRKSRRVRLQFHMVPIFSRSQTDGFWLAMPGGTRKLSLPAQRIASPALGQKFPLLSWSVESRFVVDTVLDLPAWAEEAEVLDILADVGGKTEKIGSLGANAAMLLVIVNRSVFVKKSGLSRINLLVNSTIISGSLISFCAARRV